MKVLVKPFKTLKDFFIFLKRETKKLPAIKINLFNIYRVEEHWKPQMEGLEEIVANRQIPSLHIFMSLDPVDDNVSG